jgi:hypothetical protein
LNSDGEIMGFFAAYDRTGSPVSGGVGGLFSSHGRGACRGPRGGEAGRGADPPAAGTDPFMDKIEEWVEASKGRIRADIAHQKLLAFGSDGSDRSTRRAVAGGEGGVPARSCSGAPAVGERAGDAAAARLRRRPGGGGGEDGAVRGLIGVVEVPGRVGVAGPDAAVGDRRPRPQLPHVGWGADVCADRQREDRDGGAWGGGAGVEPGDNVVRSALRGDGVDLPADRPRLQGGAVDR